MSEKSSKAGKILAIAVIASFVFTSRAAQVEPFAEKERVVFLGDSITHGGGYVGWLQLFQTLRNPGSGTVIMSAGLSGDTAGGCFKRFERDVAGKRPDRVFVMFGMNDVGHHHYTDAAAKSKDVKKKRDEAQKRYAENMRKVDKLIAKTGAAAVYMTPTPYDEYATSIKKPANRDCNEYGLAGIAGIVRKLAASGKRGGIELFDPFTEMVKKHPGRFMADRVHPGAEGHLVMAAMIFGQTGVSPFVGRCETKASALPFRYEPKSFPLPVTDLYGKVEEVYPITEKLNREIFAVKGLGEGTWELLADGKVLGEFSAKQLSDGVNLALLPTPNQLEARRLAKISGALAGGMSRMCTFFAMFDRVVRCGGNPEDRKSAFDALDKWTAQLKAKKVSTATYYSNCAESFKKTFDERAVIEKNMERQRAELDAARPKSYVISVRKKNG